MAKYETLDALIERVRQEDERKLDLLADTRRMSVEFAGEDNDLVLLVDDEADGLLRVLPSPHMRGQMATDLGIPKRYFDRMHEEQPMLLRQNIHTWMYEQPKRRMIRTYRDPYSDFEATGRAYLSDRYRRLDNIEIATRLLPEFNRLPGPVQFHQASITDENFYLRAVFPGMEREIKVGDAVQWGVQIRNSEVGAATFAIESFALRLVCTNGMVVAKVMNTRHVGKRLDDVLSDEAIRADDKAFWLAARDTLRAAMDEASFEQFVTTLQETTLGMEVQHPVAATERLGKSFSLTEAEQEAVLLNLAREGDFTQYGMVNAVTASAKSVESFDRQVELEEIGWDLANLSQRDWERVAVAA